MRFTALSAVAIITLFATLPASARIILVERCNEDQQLVLVTTVMAAGLFERGVCRLPSDIPYQIINLDGSVQTFTSNEEYLEARRQLITPAD